MTYEPLVKQEDTSLVGSETHDVLARFRVYHQTRDVAMRDQLVCQHLHLVHSLTRRFSGLGESLDDLIQEGTIGLLNAVDLFDPERGVKFTTYASHLITSQIQHYLRDRGRLIRQPAWVQELNTKVLRATEQLTQELGREPFSSEIAIRVGVPEQSVKNVLAARELNHVASLSTPADGSGDSDLSLLEKETGPAIDAEGYSLPIEDRIVLDDAISRLKVLEQKVVRLYFFDDFNQTEIARQLGISVNYASYLLRRAIGKIKTTLEEQSDMRSQPQEPITAGLPADIPTFDSFTGVYSGMYLHLRVKEEIARAQRYPTNFTLMLVNVKGGEDDRHTLTSIGRWLRDSTRVVDLVAYLGDGSFALLLPHTGREARVLGERLCHTASRKERVPFAEPSTILNLNVGFSVFPIDGAMADILFKRAHLALDTAVKQGAYQTLGASMRPPAAP
jgi:RNA polymerase sigma-B factor